ncbi:hypothetical protein TNCV_4116861 [Trichonephila clavipes]|nr:hypothetical protein TNCV_4116861 [Trichonephila clavipes]
MNEDSCCKKIFLAKPMGYRPWDRPMLRWIDCVEKDLKGQKLENSCQKQRCPEKTSAEGQGSPRAIKILKNARHINLISLNNL